MIIAVLLVCSPEAQQQNQMQDEAAKRFFS
jgi:hypothetical protein